MQQNTTETGIVLAGSENGTDRLPGQAARGEKTGIEGPGELPVQNPFDLFLVGSFADDKQAVTGR